MGVGFARSLGLDRLRRKTPMVPAAGAGKTIALSRTACIQNKSPRPFLTLACLVALLLTFGLPAAADSPRALSPAETAFIDDIGEFRPNLAKKIRRELAKTPKGIEVTKYLERRLRVVENEIKAIKKFGNKKQLETAKFTRALVFIFAFVVSDKREWEYFKKAFKLTKKEREEFDSDFTRAQDKLTEIRKARLEKARKDAEAKKRKAAEEKRQKTKPSGGQPQKSLGWGQSPAGSAGEDPRALLNALAAALDGLERREQADIVTPTARDSIPGALSAARGAVQDRQNQLVRAEILDRESRRDREARHRRDQAGGHDTETGDDTGSFADGGHRESADAGGTFERDALGETGADSGTFHSRAGREADGEFRETGDSTGIF